MKQAKRKRKEDEKDGKKFNTCRRKEQVTEATDAGRERKLKTLVVRRVDEAKG